jgi:hypothetical protein
LVITSSPAIDPAISILLVMNQLIAKVSTVPNARQLTAFRIDLACVSAPRNDLKRAVSCFDGHSNDTVDASWCLGKCEDRRCVATGVFCREVFKNPLVHLDDSDTTEGRNTIDIKAGADMRLLFSLGVLCALCQAALAQGSQECRSIPDRAARLACYDRETPPSTSRAPAMPSPRTAPTSKVDSSKYVDSVGGDDEVVNARMNGICRGC